MKRQPLLQGCRSIDEFEHLSKIDEGSYGIVYKAKDRFSDKIVAIKRVKLEKEKEGFPVTAIRELNILLRLQNENVVKLHEIAYGSSLNKIYMVMEFVDFELKSILENKRTNFTIPQIKNLVFQLLKGVDFLHRNKIIHRDLKTSNLLYSNCGTLKICDFGLARNFTKDKYTSLVCTLWYRSPEILVGQNYTEAMDLWSVGCIIAELILQSPLFPGTTDLDQITKIFKVTGNPNSENWPSFENKMKIPLNKKNKKNTLRDKFPMRPINEDDHMYLTPSGLDLLGGLLQLDPSKRSFSLDHPWFQEEPAMAIEMPKF